jgi:PKD repeat protein
VSYVWDFSEGQTETGPQASHTYLLPGSYLVTLTVTGPGGSDSDSHAYTVTIL